MRFEMSFGFRTRACRAIHMYAMHCGRFNISWRSSSWQVRIRGASSHHQHSNNEEDSVLFGHGHPVRFRSDVLRRHCRDELGCPVCRLHRFILLHGGNRSHRFQKLTFANNSPLAHLKISSHLCIINIQGHGTFSYVHSFSQRSLFEYVLFEEIEPRQNQIGMVCVWNIQGRFRILACVSSWYAGQHCLGKFIPHIEAMQAFCTCLLLSYWIGTIELASVNKQNLHSRKSRLIFVS